MKYLGHRVLASAVIAAGLLMWTPAMQAQYDRPATAPAPQDTSKKKKPEEQQKKPGEQSSAAAGRGTNAAAPGTPSQAGPELGGPNADSGAIAIPRTVKPETAPPPPPPVNQFKNPPGLGHLSLNVSAPLVNVDVGVLLEKSHQFVPNLQKDNFEVFENGVPQKITHFEQIKAPITAVLLLEFAQTNYDFIYDMKNAAYTFADEMQPHDEVAVVTYAMHTDILTDFTDSKQRVIDALNSMVIPTWDETDMFDALYTTLDRLTRVKGRKYIILVSSGLNSFSKLTLDQVLKKVRQTPDVTIFSISTGHYARIMAEGGGVGPFGGMSSMQQITFLQGDNELRTFARMTGGEYFAPRFETEMPDIFRQINEEIRNKYELSYIPTDQKKDGTYRHIQVRLVNDEGQPLVIVDKKHHRPLKYEVIAKQGYKAPLPVQ
ncbi:MAG: VWA domain-containing protein [Acidobacteriaceae bacterium]